MFIVSTLHRESLRQMMNQGRVGRSIKIRVLEMLKPQVCGTSRNYAGNHGDIKEFWSLIIERFPNDLFPKNQRNSLKIFWSTTTSMALSSTISTVTWLIGPQRVTIVAEHLCTLGREHTQIEEKICSPLDGWHWNCF